MTPNEQSKQNFKKFEAATKARRDHGCPTLRPKSRDAANDNQCPCNFDVPCHSQTPRHHATARAGHQIIVRRSSSGFSAKRWCVFFKAVKPILPSDDNTIVPIAPRSRPTLPSFNIIITTHLGWRGRPAIVVRIGEEGRYTAANSLFICSSST